MGWIIWGVVLPACLVAAWLIVRRPLRQVVEELHVDQARLLFRQQREWLEARFLKALGKLDPIERLRWEDAHWHDEVLWARDNQTRRLLALVGIHFDPDPDSTTPPEPIAQPRHRPLRIPKGPLDRRRQAARRHPARSTRWSATADSSPSPHPIDGPDRPKVRSREQGALVGQGSPCREPSVGRPSPALRIRLARAGPFPGRRPSRNGFDPSPEVASFHRREWVRSVAGGGFVPTATAGRVPENPAHFSKAMIRKAFASPTSESQDSRNPTPSRPDRPSLFTMGPGRGSRARAGHGSCRTSAIAGRSGTGSASAGGSSPGAVAAPP